MISVVIATKNRQKPLVQCLSALNQNVINLPTEIVVSHQGVFEPTTSLKNVSSIPIRFVYGGKKGKSLALNQGIAQAKGDIIAFTDDDCIVSPDWLKQVADSLKNPDISGVFGKTLPHQPELHRSEQCPSTFTPAGGRKLITKPSFHTQNIGFGNNMAFRKSVFRDIGNFRWWLGPGSIGANAEDAEFSLRALINHKTLLYNPKMIVYHNKWLAPKEASAQYRSYICGEGACYAFYTFSGHNFARKITQKSAAIIKSDLYNCLQYLTTCRLGASWSKLLNSLSRLRGFAVALLMYFVTKINARSKLQESQLH